jgi:hypothetical protein
MTQETFDETGPVGPASFVTVEDEACSNRNRDLWIDGEKRTTQVKELLTAVPLGTRFLGSRGSMIKLPPVDSLN